MSRPDPPGCKVLNWPAYDEALRRRGALTIRLGSDMTWAADPGRKRGRRPGSGDPAIQTSLTLKLRSGMALRQIEPWERHGSEWPWRGGFVASLRRRIDPDGADLDGAVPDCSTLARRQKTVAVQIPHRAPKAPRHRLRGTG